MLTDAQQRQLDDWIRAAPENARRFAEAMLLHERLRLEVRARVALEGATCVPPTSAPATTFRPRYRSLLAVVAAACVLATLVGALWNGLGDKQASAAVAELKRILAVSELLVDRTYRVEMMNEDPDRPPPPPPPPTQPKKAPPSKDRKGPRPKPDREVAPPMNGALLHVRGGRQFVLIRTALDGKQFITGSNGETSWSVRPEAPVRVSHDVDRFRRGIPGQQYSVPLINIHEGLSGLLSAYDVELDAVANPDDETQLQRIVASKRAASHRGPRRVEITYEIASGRIRDMLFIDVPRPDALPVILRLQLVEERDLGLGFFDHSAHHPPEQRVIFED
ncbi:MAG TPA: hypothetical protein PLV92_26565 [Pirellulaceae bacterium]|nr:hypothetical protein [Pirellulaceae bacterium]